MTTYGAYDAGLPCRNPNCKSHGKPHPNCRCYPGLAEGGEVSFCSTARAHDRACEYFAEGGEASDEIDPSKVILDEPKDDIIQDQVVPDEIPQDQVVPDEIPQDQVIPDEPGQDQTDYQSPNQVLGTVAEGLAQGAAGPLATLAETKLLGIPADEIAKRQAANPTEHELSKVAGLVGSAFIPFGEAALVGKAAKAAVEFTDLGKMGSAIVQGALSSGMIQGLDEVSKHILGQGDPTDAVGAALANVRNAMLTGGAGGAAGATAGMALKKVAATKLGGKTMSYLAGIASASKAPAGERKALDKGIQSLYEKGLGPKGGSYENYLAGQKFFDNRMSHMVTNAVPAAGAYVGGKVAGAGGASIGWNIGKALAKPLEPSLEKLVGPASRKYVTPIALKLISAGDTAGMLDALGHLENVAGGYAKIGKAVDALFKAGINTGVNLYGDSEKDRKSLDKYISEGGYQDEFQEATESQGEPLSYAKGGEVERPSGLKHSDGIATHFPEQNIMLTAAKGRVASYLGSLRPPDHHMKLAFDDAPDTTQAKKAYHRALDIANAPLSVLDEIRKGTVEPEHVKHFNAMYPELSGLLQKKLTEKITEAQLSGKKPPYKVRQGMSLFLGTELSGELRPENIQAAQAVFAQKSAAPQPSAGQPGPTKNTSKLAKTEQAYLTGSQALLRRGQKV